MLLIMIIFHHYDFSKLHDFFTLLSLLEFFILEGVLKNQGFGEKNLNDNNADTGHLALPGRDYSYL